MIVCKTLVAESMVWLIVRWAIKIVRMKINSFGFVMYAAAELSQMKMNQN